MAAGALVGAVAYVVLIPSPHGIPPAEPEAAPGTTAPAHETTSAPSQGERSADGPRTLADIRRLSSDFERAAALYDLLRQVDVPTLEDLLREASESQAGEATKSIIYARFADLHPDAAVTHIVATREHKRFLTNVFTTWTEHDPGAALDRAELLPPHSRRTAAVAILSALHDVELRQEVAERLDVGDVMERSVAVEDIRANPQRAWLDAVAGLADGDQTLTGWHALFSWLPTDPIGAMQAVESWPEPKVRDRWRRDLLSIWAAIDTRAAMDWAMTLPAGARRNDLLAKVAIQLAAKSPIEAVEIAAGLDASARQRVRTIAFRNWAEGDPVGALDALDDLVEPQFANAMRRSLVAAWAGTDPHAAFDWVRTQPRTADHDWLLETPLEIMAQTAPMDAVTLAVDLDAESRHVLVPNVLKAWAEDQPEAAAAWIDANAYHRPAAVVAVATSYAHLDAVGAFDWVAGLSVNIRRSTMPHLLQTISEDAPTTAQTLIDRVEDPTIRANSAPTLVWHWAGSDPEGALSWISEAKNVGNRVSLYDWVFQRWSHLDRPTALAAVRRLPPDAREGANIGMVKTALNTQDIAFVEQVFNTLEGRQRRNAAQMIFERLRAFNPDLAEPYRKPAGR